MVTDCRLWSKARKAFDIIISVWALGAASLVSATELHVSPTGDDANPGTPAKPLRTFAAAQKAVRESKTRLTEPITVYFHQGTYYLPEPVIFHAEDSGAKTAPVTYAAAPGEEAVISGGAKLDLHWEPYRDGILKAKWTADFLTDQLFVNGERQPLARFPNFDPKQPIFNGFDKDAFSPERVKRWADPRGGFIHAMHESMWGGFQYVITGKDADGKLSFEGGWQNNRPAPMHKEYRFVENIFEELDSPGEWFLDGKNQTLYFYPPAGLDLNKALIEGVRLRHLIEFKGTEEQPVKFIQLRGFTFRHAARTFMDTKESLLRSDWTIYRGGAVLFEGAEDCGLADCFIDQVGGNAVFVNNYNRRVTMRGCHIAKVGANGVAFVGDPQAVRSAASWKDHPTFETIDHVPGPKSRNYPADCLVEDCLIYLSGRVEKQTAPVEIDMAQDITVRHCSIYDTPRAGLNIGDGCWGGHVIEFCDIFDTVKETGDHGSFNSWGRDRYWQLQGVDLNTVTLGTNAELPFLDAVKPVILRHNRWRCDHGWDIDLDDGSTQYEIRDNLCLNGGIKNREGFHRVVENNIMVNNSFHPHVWFGNSQDVFRHNIVFGNYQPIGMKAPWGREIDFNFLHQPGLIAEEPAGELQRQSGRDEHSLKGDAKFIDPDHGDFRVQEQSPALRLGFRNFSMTEFGVLKPSLRAIARAPLFGQSPPP